MKIKHLIGINEGILIVYCTSAKCYQYAIAFYDGSIYQPQEIYYTAKAALEVGLETIKVVIGRE